MTSCITSCTLRQAVAHRGHHVVTMHEPSVFCILVQAKNDALFVPSQVYGQPKEFAFIGLQVKKKLTSANLPKAIDQALSEFLVWGLHSYSAYIQV